MGKIFKNKKVIFIVGAVVIVLAVVIPIAVVYGRNCGGGSEGEGLTEGQVLELFQNSLSLDKTSLSQNMERSIVIRENEAVVGNFSQVLKIENFEGLLVARLLVEEKYPAFPAGDFDLQDDYYLIGDIMYMRRVTSEETVTYDFEADLTLFWETADANMGNSAYNFSSENFSDVAIDKKEGFYGLTAKVRPEKIEAFFGEGVDTTLMEDVCISSHIGLDGRLEMFQLNYAEDGRAIGISIRFFEPEKVEIADWLGDYM